MDLNQKLADDLLWPLWCGIGYSYKRKYARSIWQQFEDHIRSSAYTGKMTKFLENICHKLEVEWRHPSDAASVAYCLNELQDQEALRALRSETVALVLLVRLRSQERKAEIDQTKKSEDHEAHADILL